MKMNHHSSKFVTQETKLSKKEIKIVFIPIDYLKNLWDYFSFCCFLRLRKGAEIKFVAVS